VGLIRKTMAVSTLGLVRGSSKKQRVAKASLKELRKQTELMRQEAQQLAAQPLPAPPRSTGTGPATQREQEVQALWRLHKDGVLTKEQYEAAYNALPPLAS
jgi:hypothetical protein